MFQAGHSVAKGQSLGGEGEAGVARPMGQQSNLSPHSPCQPRTPEGRVWVLVLAQAQPQQQRAWGESTEGVPAERLWRAYGTVGLGHHETALAPHQGLDGRLGARPSPLQVQPRAGQWQLCPGQGEVAGTPPVPWSPLSVLLSGDDTQQGLTMIPA